MLCPGGGCQRPRLSPPGVCCASVPDGRSSYGPLCNVVNAPERRRLRIPENQLPDGVRNMAGLGGAAEPKSGDFLVHHGDISQRGRGLYPTVVLQPFLDPTVVQAIRRLVQHQLKDGLAGPDLQKAGAPSPRCASTPCSTCTCSPPGSLWSSG